MTEIIVTSKTDLEQIVQNSVLKALQKQSEAKEEVKDKYFSVEEAANYLQLATQTVYGFTSKRKIPFRKRGKKIYFKQSELDDWLDKGKKKSTDEIESELNAK